MKKAKREAPKKVIRSKPAKLGLKSIKADDFLADIIRPYRPKRIHRPKV